MPSSIAIYVSEKKNYPRLRYVLQWIFDMQFQVPFRLFSNEEEWRIDEGFKINYSKENLAAATIQIIPEGLLFEQMILKKPQLAVQRWHRKTVLFYNQPTAKVPFDIFSAVFYLISRYEEYLPHQADKHGRYEAKQSVAGQYHFLEEPIVDQWLFHLRDLLLTSGMNIPEKKFEQQITFDVDMVWQYKHRGTARYWGGHLRDLIQLKVKNIQERIAVCSGKKTDAYFSFPELLSLHKKYKTNPIFFMLLGQPGRFDRNNKPEHPAMQKFIADLSVHYDLGIHPSYGSHCSVAVLKSEIALLAQITQKKITKSRQHFIKFTLPETYRNLLEQGIEKDYSMGYASHNGFRAGTSNPFFWYDLKREQCTTLKVYPFAFMDATSRYYRHQSPGKMFLEWHRLYLKVKEVQGCMVSIWHNFILSRQSEWLKQYEETLKIMSEGD